MDDSIIYRKTRRGATELAATHGTLSHAARRVLILLNGERTLSELADLFGSDTVEHVVADLEAQGFARQIDPSEAGETTQAIPTQTIPTRVGDLRPMAHEAPPAARRASGWIAMGLFGAAVVVASAYWLVWRPNHTGPATMAAGQAAEEGNSTRTVEPQRIVRELPLSGLPAVTVSANPAAKAAAATANAETSAVEDTGAVVPASASAIVPAAASPESAAPGRRASERTASTASTAGPKSAPSEAESAPTPSPPAAARPAPATVASASNTRLEQTAVDAPAAEATSVGPVAANERDATAAARSVPVAATTSTPPAAAAASAPSDKPPAATPSPRPKGEPGPLRPGKHDPPEFPGRALRARVLEGHVLAHVWITAEGTVDQVDIVKATPTRVFDDEVKRALSQWTFDPPGHTVDTTVELDFKQ